MSAYRWYQNTMKTNTIHSLWNLVYYGRTGNEPWSEWRRKEPMTIDNNGRHGRTFMVQCWVYPKSGMELAEKQKTMTELKAFLGHVFKDEHALEDGLQAFQKEVDGYVLHPFFMKSYDSIQDPEVEFMPKIRTSAPEARFASCQEVPNSA